MDSVTLRLAVKEEAQICYGFIEEARAFQREQGFVQWSDDYPVFVDIQEDIAAGKGYLLCEGGDPFGYIFLDFEDEPAYGDIEGQWRSDQPYAVMHKVAFGKAARGKGASKELFRLAREASLSRGIHSLRIDTHRENGRMQHILDREGFEYCGIVYYSGAPRRAYELIF